ncbi:MAG: cytidine deaminase [Alphaproteobacteria bacterium]
MTNSLDIDLPPLRIPDTVIETDAGKIVLPGQAIEAKTVTIDPAKVGACMEAARRAASGAYAPYSGFHVGAAVVMADDPAQEIRSGVNVENGSYGLTVCAERSCISTAVTVGFRTIRYLAVSAPASLDGPLSGRMPCGACRQVIQEFSGNAGAPEETLVFVDTADPDVLGAVFDVPRLLAHGFSFDGPRD